MVRSFDNEKEKGDRQANYILNLIIVIVVGYVSAFVYFEITKVELGKNNCPVSEKPRGEYVVLFDRTDKDKDSALVDSDIKQTLEKIKNDIPQYARLSVYVITDELTKNYQPVSEPLCNPGNLKDENWFVRKVGLNKTPIRIKKDWEKKFANIVDETYEKIIEPSQSSFSPIFEMIQAINVMNFKLSSEEYENKLIIFSDMLHYMPNEFSLFQDNPKFDDFKKSHNNYYKKIHTNLNNNVFIKVNLVPRHEKIKYQTKILEDFWLDYFDDINASYILFNEIGS